MSNASRYFHLHSAATVTHRGHLLPPQVNLGLQEGSPSAFGPVIAVLHFSDRLLFSVIVHGRGIVALQLGDSNRPGGRDKRLYKFHINRKVVAVDPCGEGGGAERDDQRLLEGPFHHEISHPLLQNIPARFLTTMIIHTISATSPPGT